MAAGLSFNLPCRANSRDVSCVSPSEALQIALCGLALMIMDRIAQEPLHRST